ncbi:MAG TPA: hypothetical protein VK608_07095 [Edaphobacter sp.]|jgi:DNA end-binding protein Ku|nr:hypothetical protein [Edaphobacter sp.]
MIGESLELAESLITKRAAKPDLSKFEDGYELAVRELVDAKVKHMPIPHDEGVKPVRGNGVSLMDALKKVLVGIMGRLQSYPRRNPLLV